MRSVRWKEKREPIAKSSQRWERPWGTGWSGQGRTFQVKQQRQRWKSASCQGQYSGRAGVPKTRRGSDLRPPRRLGLQLLLLRVGLRPLRRLAPPLTHFHSWENGAGVGGGQQALPSLIWATAGHGLPLRLRLVDGRWPTDLWVQQSWVRILTLLRRSARLAIGRHVPREAGVGSALAAPLYP